MQNAYPVSDFGLLLVLFHVEFQGFAAVGADNGALFQGLLVEVDHFAADALNFVDGGILIAEIEPFFVFFVLVIPVEVILVIVIFVLIVHDEVLDGVQIFLDLVQLIGNGNGGVLDVSDLPSPTRAS